MSTRSPKRSGALSLQPSAPASLTPVRSADVDRLDPAQLSSSTEAAVRALLSEGESANTVRSYQTALRYWAAWYALRYQQAIVLPVAIPAVIQFIVDHVERMSANGLESSLPQAIDESLVLQRHKALPGPLALSTVMHRISALSKLHQLQGHASPCHDVAVRELLSRVRRAYAKRGRIPGKKAALTRTPFDLLLETCDDSLRGVRDRALLLFAWSSGGRRRSEVVGATVGNLHQVSERVYTYTLRHSKTNQTGSDRQDNVKPVVGLAAEAMTRWLQRSGIDDGPIFRRIRRGDRLAEVLAPSAVRHIVKARAVMAGLGHGYSAHSLRSGFITEAARQNVPMGDAMALTGHRSVNTVIGYFRATAAVQSKAAWLLDEDFKPSP
jgi:integrase